jgi:thiamine pyrophosphokinase
MSSQKTIILAGADIDDYDWLGQQVGENDFIICADSGLGHAHEINIKPNIIIGDFDSVDPDLLDQYRDKSEITHDDNQNATDLMKAIDRAPKGQPIDIYGAMGQRADHDFSNYLILMRMDHPDYITLKSKNETRRVVKSSTSLRGRVGDYLGLFPLSPISNFETRGLKYAPDVLGGPYQFGWNGACNEMISTEALISFDEGTILITHSNKGE